MCAKQATILYRPQRVNMETRPAGSFVNVIHRSYKIHSLAVLFDVDLKKLLNKHSRCLWSESQLHPCDVTY